MRKARWISVIVLGLLFLDSGLSYGQFPFSRPKRAEKAKPAPGKVVAKTEAAAPMETVQLTASGFANLDDKDAKTARDIAEKFALEDAQKAVLSYFAEQGVPLDWKPPEKYIQEHLIKDRFVESQQHEEPVGKGEEVRLQIEINSKSYHDILKKDREFRTRGRLFSLAKGLAVLVALLGVVAGYFRLEDLTKGYLTSVLRVAAIGFVSAIVVLLLLLG
jgi:hypothetical protein